MIQNPIHKVLFLIQKHQVRSLLMGGQACILYGAAEFSRDIDLVLFVNPKNLVTFNAFLKDVQAQCIAVPPFETEYLNRGHAIHFRCLHPDVLNVRIDVMSTMRGVDHFERLWERRTSFQDSEGSTYDLLSLPDLVQAKKTQRDKDWPMIRRLLEAHYFQNRENHDKKHIHFWLKEMRSPELLINIVQRYQDDCQKSVEGRSLLTFALEQNREGLANALVEEEYAEREKDRIYWLPLKKELETLRHEKRKRL